MTTRRIHINQTLNLTLNPIRHRLTRSALNGIEHQRTGIAGARSAARWLRERRYRQAAGNNQKYGKVSPVEAICEVWIKGQEEDKACTVGRNGMAGTEQH